MAWPAGRARVRRPTRGRGLAGARERHITRPALLLDALGSGQAALVGQGALSEPQPESVSTRVLPLPAPARTSTGPMGAVTAAHCSAFKDERNVMLLHQNTNS
jgi:hypothetical protein